MNNNALIKKNDKHISVTSSSSVSLPTVSGDPTIGM
jgi:hypothetical protein